MKTQTIRKLGLFLVMGGALSLSFSGQVDAVAPLLGRNLGFVFAATNDLAALLALNVVASGRGGSVGRWAWAVLILAGGTGLGLNTWDAIQKHKLPAPWAVLVGAEPVVLAWVLSHMVALVVGERETGPEATPEPASATASEPITPTATNAVDRPSLEALATGAGSTREIASVAGHDTSTQPARQPVGDQHEAAGSGASETVPGGFESSSDPLVDQAERLERKALAASGGKQGLTYREAQRRLRVRYDAAKDALKAARARIAATAESGSRPAA